MNMKIVTTLTRKDGKKYTVIGRWDKDIVLAPKAENDEQVLIYGEDELEDLIKAGNFHGPKTEATEKKGYGYGKVKYKTLADFPYVIRFKGETFFKTPMEYHTADTGMLSAEYQLEKSDARRVYMDAAGNKIED
jgi:hypothetical protein